MMKIKQNMTLLVWIQRSKAKISGFAPISVRVTIDGISTEISLGEKVQPEHWDINEKCVTKKAPEYKTINRFIDAALVDILRHFDRLSYLHDTVTPLMVKHAYKGIDRTSAKIKEPEMVKEDTLLDVFDEFIKGFTKLVQNKKRSDGTLRHWRTTKGKVLDFLINHHKKNDISLLEIRPSFGDELYEYLTLDADSKLSDPTAKGHIKKIKQIIKLGVKKQLIPSNPIGDFVCGGDINEVIPLEYHQVLKIYQKDFGLDRLNEVRDSYIFQCFTGFAYQDLYALSPENIILVGQENQKWLIKNRGKTGVAETVPMLPIIEELIEKYKHHPKCKARNSLMPIDSNSNYNGYLKEIAVICGIDRNLNTHLARHTFADIMLNLGVPLEDVSKMLGHNSIRTTQRYCRVRKERIIRNVNEFVLTKLFCKEGKLKLVV